MKRAFNIDLDNIQFCKSTKNGQCVQTSIQHCNVYGGMKNIKLRRTIKMNLQNFSLCEYMLSISTNTITQTIITIDITVNSSQAQLLIRRVERMILSLQNFRGQCQDLIPKFNYFIMRLLWAPLSNLSMFQIFQENIVFY